ncbi:MAG TPA: DivIVA domain-containing protein [Actinophytocola sp.]|jgi:DivIVA domain-containing protein|uniref:DivIVA domain-containing protein n=1 Tax=Actinophytocola sp. TaxID=1872138 RepID=UPI002E0500A0|nr:DivIVA domain-containing protein [Actinophytocola sp.]
MDREPLTPDEVRNVVFDKAPLGKRGYRERQVDDFLDRIEAALRGRDNLSAADVRDVAFEEAPRVKRGYHEDQVDSFLDIVITTLEQRERAPANRLRPANGVPDPRSGPDGRPRGAGQPLGPDSRATGPDSRRASGGPPPGSRSGGPDPRPGDQLPGGGSWQNGPPSLRDVRPVGGQSPGARVNGPAGPPSLRNVRAVGGQSPAPRANGPAGPPSLRDIRPAGGQSPGARSAEFPIPPGSMGRGPGTSTGLRAVPPPSGRGPVPVRPDPTEQTNPMPLEPPVPRDGPLALGARLSLPIPPAPPGAHGYRPADVERLAALLALAVEQANGPTFTDLMNARLNWTPGTGQGYHTGVVDALLSAWVAELRRRDGG